MFIKCVLNNWYDWILRWNIEKWIETKENSNFVSSSNVAYDTYYHMIPLINVNYSTIFNYLTTTINQLPYFNDYSF